MKSRSCIKHSQQGIRLPGTRQNERGRNDNNIKSAGAPGELASSLLLPLLSPLGARHGRNFHRVPSEELSPYPGELHRRPPTRLTFRRVTAQPVTRGLKRQLGAF